MKTIYLLPLLFSSILYADCTKKPMIKEIKTAISQADYTQAKSLLNRFKLEVKTYLDTCDKSNEMFEEMNLMLLNCTDQLSDLKENIHTKNNTIKCSIVPSSIQMQKAFNAQEHKKIKDLYPQYKKDSDNYIKYCASEASYGEVYEASMLCDEKYEAWKKEGH
jgi:small-conductance mechanosensitive channel